MRITLLALFLLLSSLSQAQTPQWIWAQSAGGRSNNEGLTQMARDASGNMYVTGDFEGTKNFGAASLTATGFADLFIVKYDNSGILQWAYNFGGTNNISEPGGIAIDAAGNIFVAAYFSNIITLNSVNYSSAGNKDIIVMKLNSSGIVTTAYQIGGSGADIPGDLKTLGNDVYLAGSYSGTFTYNGLSFPASNGSTEDGFVLKMSNTGAPAWVSRMGGSGVDRVLSLSVSSNKLYASGSFASVGASFGSTTLSTSGGNDMFVTRMDPVGGTFSWAKKMGGVSTDNGSGVGQDSFGNVYVAGAYLGNVSFGTGVTLTGTLTYNDGYVAKYDSSGTAIWARKISNNQNPDEANHVSVDALGGVYVTGYFASNVTIQGGTNPNVILSTSGGYDCFLLRYNISGALAWALKVGGTGNESGKFVLADAGGFCHLAGNFANTITITGVGTLTAPAGAFGLFNARLNGFTTGIAPVLPDLAFGVYPNPASDELTVNVPHEEGSEITIVNLAGQVLDQRICDGSIALQSFDISHYASGTYIVTLSVADGRKASQRVVVN